MPARELGSIVRRPRPAAIDHASAVGDELVRRYRAARRDPELAVLEGFHALKHALRFGASVTEAIAVDPEEVERMAGELAPDLAGSMHGLLTRVSEEVLGGVVPHAPRIGTVAIARRPAVDPRALLADPRPAPLVLLEDPRTMGNMGACVRVAAAADAAGVLTTGGNDPWHPDALRGAAGLHFALPVAAAEAIPESDRPLVALDPGGDPLGAGSIPPRAILAFGTERHGLSEELLGRADARMAIPMRDGVSSLNLATSVAVVLFSQRL